MPRTSSLKRSDRAAPAPPGKSGAGGLRLVLGGVDLDEPPIHVPPILGETEVSWLRRAAVRYQISPQDVLRTGGTVKTVHSAAAAKSRLRAGSAYAARLGLGADELAVLHAPPPLDQAVEAWERAYHRTLRTPPSSRHRFCPACLAVDEPYWHAEWSNPLLVVCPVHEVALVQGCPVCGKGPHETKSWLGTPTPIWQCPSRRPAPAPPGRGRGRPWCATDLRNAPVGLADPELVAAQRLVIDMAAMPDEPWTLAGIPATGRIGTDAVLELITAHSVPTQPARSTILTPTRVAPRLIEIARLLTTTNESQAAHALQRLLQPHSAQAPIHVAPSKADRPRSPLLGTLQLTEHGAFLPAGTQLTLHLGATHGRYPHAANTNGPRRTQMLLPEHQAARVLPRGLIPQAIWPGSLPGLDESDLVDAAAGALLLARTGTTTPWTELIDYLGLPESFVVILTARLRYWRAQGTWTELLAQVEALHSQVTAHRPPIGYRTRRTVAADTDLVHAALVDANDGKRPGLEVEARFYEQLTGSHAAWHPGSYNQPGQDPGWGAARSQIDAEHTTLFETAFDLLRHRYQAGSGHDLSGPLTWAPPPPSTQPTTQPRTHEEQP